MASSSPSSQLRVVAAFALVYLFWGSTYLAIGIADNESIPPVVLCATRFLIAGPLMLLACAFLGKRIAVGGREFLRLAAIGFLLLVTSNTGLAWAEQYVATGLASLIVAITPIWMFVLEAFVFRGERTSGRGIAGLILGVIGTCILLFPDLRQHGSTETNMPFWGATSLLGSSFLWALGSVLSRRWRSHFKVDAITATAWEMTIAGGTLLLLALLLYRGERIPWSARGIGAILYLVVCGSWIGFTAYIWLLKHVPTAKVATYAYVNPIVAVFLGWLVLHERIDAYIAAGSVVIILAVALVTGSKVSTAAQDPGLPEVESTGD